MSPKTCLSVAVLISAAVGCVFLMMQPSGTSLQEPASGVGLPVRLRIPDITVDAAIESVGLTSKMEMDVPSDPNNAGWYNLGKRPGEKGSAVIGGHLDTKDGEPAVFQNLSKLRKGDTVFVETDDGLLLTFVVGEIRVYQPREYAPDVFKKDDDGRHVNLVTCSGPWDTARHIYSERLVVFTDMVNVTENERP